MALQWAAAKFKSDSRRVVAATPTVPTQAPTTTPAPTTPTRVSTPPDETAVEVEDMSEQEFYETPIETDSEAEVKHTTPTARHSQHPLTTLTQ